MFERSNGSPIPDSMDDTTLRDVKTWRSRPDSAMNDTQAKWIADVIELVGAVLGVLERTCPKH